MASSTNHWGTVRIIKGNEIREVPLVKAFTFVGREPQSDILIAHGSVSRRHFGIHHTSSGVVVHDFSRSGIYINSTELVKHRTSLLKDGDVVSFKNNTAPSGASTSDVMPCFQFIFGDTGDSSRPVEATTSSESNATAEENNNAEELMDFDECLRREMENLDDGPRNSDSRESSDHQRARSRSPVRVVSEASSASLPPPETMHQVLDSIADTVTCSICMELAHDAVSPCQCLHTFCGGCLSSWIFRRGSPRVQCPKCRTNIRSVARNHVAATIASELEKVRPGDTKCPEDKTAMDAVNKFPGKTVFHLMEMFASEYGSRVVRSARRRRRNNPNQQA